MSERPEMTSSKQGVKERQTKRKLNHEKTKHSHARSKTGEARDEISRYCADVGRGRDRNDHVVRGERLVTVRGAHRHCASHGFGGGCEGQRHRPRWCAV